MASLNRVTIIGNLGRDPEVRNFQNGGKIVNLRVACSESWKDKTTGERKERTEWVSVAISNEGLAKVAEQYLRKGSQVYIEGKLETRKWQDQSGQDRYTTEVVVRPYRGEIILLGSRQGGGNAGGSGGGEDGGYQNYGSGYDQGPEGGSSGGSGRSSGAGAGRASRRSDLDDEIPFSPEWRA